MNNILNVRVRRLLKDDLLSYTIHFAGFILVLFAIMLINNILYLFFGFGSPTVNINVNNRELDINFLRSLITFISFGAISMVMFISGIVAGAELPANVRKGIARIEYFTATFLAGIIVSFLISPIFLGINAIINLFVSSEALFYNSLLIGDGSLPLLGAQFLIYIAVFLIGYSITMIWQRFGWIVGLAISFIILSTTGIIGFNIGRIFSIFELIVEDYWLELSWQHSNGSLAIMGLSLAIVFGALTYILLKKIPVKAR